MTLVPPERSREGRAAALLAGIVTLAIGLAIVDSLPVGVFYDDAMYVVLAKALATGHGYHWLNIPGAPAATHFPPGYPALLAVIWRAFPTFPANVLAFKVVNAALLAIVAASMVIFIRRRFGLSPLAAALISIAGCVAIPALVLSSLVLSEPLFLATLIPILIFAERVVEGERRMRDLVLLGLLVGGATLIRTHGVALVAGAVVALVLRPPRSTSSVNARVRDAGLVAVCAIAVMIPWQLWVHANQGLVPEPMRGLYESYASWMSRGVKDGGLPLLLQTISRTSLETAGTFATIASPMLSGWSRVLTVIALALLLIAGARRTWREAPVTTLFLAAYVAIVIAWPYTPARFIWGVWPLFVLVLTLGAIEIKSWAPRVPHTEAARVLLLACSLFVAVGYGRYNVRGYRARWWSNIARSQAEHLRPVVMWARARTRPTDVLASSADPAVYLYSGRLAVPATAFTARDYFRPATVVESQTALRQILAAYHIDAVVVVSDSVRVAAQSMASGSRPELVLRDSMPSGLVFAPVQSPLLSQHPAHQ